MDIVAGKNGSFFVVTDMIDTDTSKKLANISFDEFGRYNAWPTMKKISHMSEAEYVEKNGLKLEILQKFDRFREAVDYKATQDLLFFIENEGGREQIEDRRGTSLINPENFKNGFLHPAPRELSGMITDSFEIKDQDVPRMLKSLGIVIVRSVISYFVKWNSVTYKVDVIPSSKDARKGAFNGDEITIGENCYIFQSDDWRHIKKIEYRFNQEKISRKTSWFRFDKPEDEIFEDVLKKVCKDSLKCLIYNELYKKYLSLKQEKADYRGIFIHEFHHLRNKILFENRCLKPNTKALLAPDMYYILVEDERSAHLAAAIDHINQYWHDHNWEKLLKVEPCFEILAFRSESERNRLLVNLDFVTNAKLKYWTENDLDDHFSKILHRIPILHNYCSVAKGIDNDRKEYLRMRSMLYSFWIYDPFSQRYYMKRLDKYIKIDIPVTTDVSEKIIARSQSFIERKLKSKELLVIKYGFSDDQIRKAANIYDTRWRIKRDKN